MAIAPRPGETRALDWGVHRGGKGDEEVVGEALDVLAAKCEKEKEK